MKFFRRVIPALAAAWLLAPGVATAQDANDSSAEASYDGYGERVSDAVGPRVGRRFELNGLGGVQGYTGGAAGLVAPGATYGASVGVNTGRRATVEFGYNGSTFATSNNATGDRAAIFENGGQAVLKVSPFATRLEPYAFGGVGVSRLNVLGGQSFAVSDTGSVNDDWLVKVPVGVGLDYNFFRGQRADVKIGARGSYGLVLDDDAFQGINDATQQAQVGVQVGAQF